MGIHCINQTKWTKHNLSLKKFTNYERNLGNPDTGVKLGYKKYEKYTLAKNS